MALLLLTITKNNDRILSDITTYETPATIKAKTIETLRNVTKRMDL
jgi:hypothetical protein